MVEWMQVVVACVRMVEWMQVVVACVRMVEWVQVVVAQRHEPPPGPWL